MNRTASKNKMKGVLALWSAAVVGCSVPTTALAQEQGGVYIAGNGFTFEQAADQGIAKNPKGQRFFILAVPPHTEAVTRSASKAAAAARDRATARGAVLLVCQRDIDNGSLDPAKLVPGVVTVRGFPPPGSDALPHGARYFPGEDADRLPKSTEALRRLRVTCS